mmetsp:Transcript_27248/g.91600  ORF Transcript_27248/g.91600 Transcript_27248/m.91600 type:complete len:237 (-) Transcript_27248:169-879(-)
MTSSKRAGSSSNAVASSGASNGTSSGTSNGGASNGGSINTSSGRSAAAAGAASAIYGAASGVCRWRFGRVKRCRCSAIKAACRLFSRRYPSATGSSVCCAREAVCRAAVATFNLRCSNESSTALFRPSNHCATGSKRCLSTPLASVASTASEASSAARKPPWTTCSDFVGCIHALNVSPSPPASGTRKPSRQTNRRRTYSLGASTNPSIPHASAMRSIRAWPTLSTSSAIRCNEDS